LLPLLFTGEERTSALHADFLVPSSRNFFPQVALVLRNLLKVIVFFCHPFIIHSFPSAKTRFSPRKSLREGCWIPLLDSSPRSRFPSSAQFLSTLPEALLFSRSVLKSPPSPRSLIFFPPRLQQVCTYPSAFLSFFPPFLSLGTNLLKVLGSGLCHSRFFCLCFFVPSFRVDFQSLS